MFNLLCVEQLSGGGGLRAGSAHGRRQARGEVVAGETVRPEEAWPQEEVHGGGKPLLDGSWDDPRYDLPGHLGPCFFNST